MKAIEQRRWLRTAIYICLALLMAGLILSYNDQRSRDHRQALQLKEQTRQLKQQTRQLAAAVEENDTARQALCALRRDRRKEVAQGEQFLKRNPEGAFGFTAAEIRKSLDEKRTTLKALSILHCNPKEER
jgi:type II secretory pathway pseudopilin PulG